MWSSKSYRYKIYFFQFVLCSLERKIVLLVKIENVLDHEFQSYNLISKKIMSMPSIWVESFESSS